MMDVRVTRISLMKEPTIKTTHETTVVVELDKDEMNSILIPFLIKKANLAMSKAGKPRFEEMDIVRINRYRDMTSTDEVRGSYFTASAIFVMKHE